MTAEEKGQALIAEASKWVGVLEEGHNSGEQIEAFQRAIDTYARKEPWCMGFVQFCLYEMGGTDIFPSEHCLTVWNKSPRSLRLMNPKPGCIVVWKRRGTISGHTGIVTAVNGTTMTTIEGNTGPDKGVNRDGDGVYEKTHDIRPTNGKFELVGFLWPWREGP